MQVWTPSAQPKDDGEFDVRLNPGTKSGGPFAIIGLSEDGMTALTIESPADCDRLIKAVIQAKSMLLGETAPPVPQGDKPLCGEAKAGVGGVMCTRPADHAGGHKHEYSGAYWPRHDGGSEDLDAALTPPETPARDTDRTPPGHQLPAGELTVQDGAR